MKLRLIHTPREVGKPTSYWPLLLKGLVRL